MFEDTAVMSYNVLLLSEEGEGPSLDRSCEILMASSMADSRPSPPSPRRAGPKHSGRRMSSLTTTLAFSSTLSPGRTRAERRSGEHSASQGPQRHGNSLTVAEDGESQEVQIAFALHGVPANVRVSFVHQHHTTLKTTASQVLHHLKTTDEEKHFLGIKNVHKTYI